MGPHSVGSWTPCAADGQVTARIWYRTVVGERPWHHHAINVQDTGTGVREGAVGCQPCESPPLADHG